jgi:hypothetical protein
LRSGLDRVCDCRLVSHSNFTSGPITRTRRQKFYEYCRVSNKCSRPLAPNRRGRLFSAEMIDTQTGLAAAMLRRRGYQRVLRSLDINPGQSLARPYSGQLHACVSTSVRCISSRFPQSTYTCMRPLFQERKLCGSKSQSRRGQFVAARLFGWDWYTNLMSNFTRSAWTTLRFLVRSKCELLHSFTSKSIRDHYAVAVRPHTLYN